MTVLMSLMIGCEVEALVGVECLELTEVATNPTVLLWRTADCAFQEVPGDTGLAARPDWIEVCNPSRFPIRSRGYLLALDPGDNPYAPDPLIVPDTELAPGECLVVVGIPNQVGLCSEIANFDLDKELGANLHLELEGLCYDSTRFVELLPGMTWSRDGGEWHRESVPTPMRAVLP